MRARIDISEVEAQTKIRAKYLRALENEEWDLLPGSVYVKSFLKTYGNYLGLDSRLLIDEFKRRYESPMDHEPRATSSVSSGGRDRERERGPRQRRRPRVRSGMLISPPVVIIALLIGIVVALYLIGTIGSGGHGGGSTTPLVDTQTSNNGTTSTPSTSTTKTKKKKKRVTVQIVPTATIYLCVKQGNGKQLLVGTYAAGQTVPAVKAKKLLVTFGNANATVKFNGKPYTLTPSSTPIGVQFTHSGAKSLAQGPTCA